MEYVMGLWQFWVVVAEKADCLFNPALSDADVTKKAMFLVSGDNGPALSDHPSWPECN